MSVYLKKASKASATGQERIRNTVYEILDSIRNRGETAVREYAAKFDNWKRDFILSEDEIQQLITSVPKQVKDDIAFAYDQVYGFALRKLRVAFSWRSLHSCLWRQSVRNQSHFADKESWPLFRGVECGQIHQNPHVSEINPGC